MFPNHPLPKVFKLLLRSFSQLSVLLSLGFFFFFFWMGGVVVAGVYVVQAGPELTM